MFISYNTADKLPLYGQIYRDIRDRIRSGALAEHSKLPSTRAMAQTLGVSRNTVDLAYAQLQSEGYIEAVPRSGYYVCRVSSLLSLPEQAVRKPVPTPPKETTVRYDFSPFAANVDSFPFATWKRLSNQCMNEMDREMFLLGESAGDLALRQAIADYLRESRGVCCTAEQVLVGAGSDYLLQLLAQLLQTEGISRLAFENPAYLRAASIFQGFGYQVCPIPVGRQGMEISVLHASNAQAVYVTPTNQYPLGAAMPIGARMELLAWAGRERYIIEDDHDSEFRYKGRPIPALQGSDREGRVIYLGTFSRAVAPAIRVGYMVLPETLRETVRSRFSYYACTVSRIDQSILTAFMKGGYFERHLNKMRKLYRTRHDTLLRALRRYPRQVSVRGENAGLHIVAEFLREESEETLLLRAAELGIRLRGLSQYYLTGAPERPTVLLGFANLSETELEAGIDLLFAGGERKR